MLVGIRIFWSRIARPSDLWARRMPMCALFAALCFLAGGASRPASAQTLTKLHDFGLSPDGDSPSGSLISVGDGSFVGTTEFGGTNGTGCVYEITTSGVETILYSFTARDATSFLNNDGAFPVGGVILGADGNYYGCTTAGGTAGFGTAFMLTPAGVFTPLYEFSGSDGASPVGLVESATAGTFYGTSEAGGSNGTGTVFQMVVTTITTTEGTETITDSIGTVTTLYSFSALDATGSNTDGANPLAPPTLGTDGNLYGTTSAGGNNGGAGAVNGESVGGTVWQLILDGEVFTVLHPFTALDGNEFNEDGTHPQAALVQVSDGSFIGSCRDGGVNGTGTIFDITTVGTYSVVHAFGAVTSVAGASPALNADGIAPSVPVIQLADGTIYGTCSAGGTGGLGTIFDIPTTAETTGAALTFGTFALVYSFGSQSSSVQDGNDPLSGLATDGTNLYGATAAGGDGAGSAGISLGGIFFELPLAAPATAAGPTITGLSPATALAGGGAFTLTVTGTGFDMNSVVDWAVTSHSGTPVLTQTLATTFVSATKLTAIVPASLIGIDATLNAGTAETHPVTVLDTVANTASTANALSLFTVEPSVNTPPSITKLSLTSVTAGSAATALIIIGTRFFTGDTVSIGGTVLTPTQITATQITVTVPASLLTKAQNLSVIVSSSAGASNALTFTVGPVTTYFGGLQLISLPYDYPGVALSDIFGYSDPKLAVWNAAAGIYAVTPTAPANAIRLGTGYWIRFPTVTNVILAGTGAPTDTPFAISLVKGWNMIGDPFTTTAPGTGITVVDAKGMAYTFSDAATAGIINSSTYSYDLASNGYILENTGDMQPFLGYWIFADEACTLEVNGS